MSGGLVQRPNALQSFQLKGPEGSLDAIDDTD